MSGTHFHPTATSTETTIASDLKAPTLVTLLTSNLKPKKFDERLDAERKRLQESVEGVRRGVDAVLKRPLSSVYIPQEAGLGVSIDRLETIEGRKPSLVRQ